MPNLDSQLGAPERAQKQQQKTAATTGGGKKQLVIRMGGLLLFPLFFGGALLLGMFYMTSCLLIGMGYFTAASLGLAGLVALALAVQNMAVGWGATLMALSSGLIMLGLIWPFYRGSSYLRQRYLLLHRGLKARALSWLHPEEEEQEANEDEANTEQMAHPPQ